MSRHTHGVIALRSGRPHTLYTSRSAVSPTLTRCGPPASPATPDGELLMHRTGLSLPSIARVATAGTLALAAAFATAGTVGAYPAPASTATLGSTCGSIA